MYHVLNYLCICPEQASIHIGSIRIGSFQVWQYFASMSFAVAAACLSYFQHLLNLIASCSRMNLCIHNILKSQVTDMQPVRFSGVAGDPEVPPPDV